MTRELLLNNTTLYRPNSICALMLYAAIGTHLGSRYISSLHLIARHTSRCIALVTSRDITYKQARYIYINQTRFHAYTPKIVGRQKNEGIAAGSREWLDALGGLPMAKIEK